MAWSYNPEAAELPWEKQRGESRQAFQAFRVYLEMGSERALQRTAKALGKSMSLMGGWSRKWGWLRRCEKWDAEQQRLRDKVSREAIEESIATQRKMAKALLGEAALELAARRKGKRCPECLRTADPLTPAEIAKYVKVGVDVDRLACGLNTSGSPQINIGVQVNLQPREVSLVLLRDEPLQRMASELLERMQAVKVDVERQLALPAPSPQQLAGRKGPRAKREKAAAPANGNGNGNGAGPKDTA